MKVLSTSSLMFGVGAVSCALATTQSRPTESRAVNHPRPLAEVLKTFQDRYGWIVTYEDALFGDADVVDVTEQVRNPAAEPSGHRVLGPKGGPLTVSFTRPAAESTVIEVTDLLTRFTAEHNASGYPGKFRVIHSADVFHVVPQSSILDALISLPPQEGRNAVDTLTTIFAALGRATGQKIVFGTAPHNLLMQTPMEEGMTSATGRDVLMRTLKATGRELSWRLLYSRDLKQKALNIRIVNAGN